MSSGVNLINIFAAFFKPAWVLNFSEAYFESYIKFKLLNILPEAQKQPQALGHEISSCGKEGHKKCKKVEIFGSEFWYTNTYC